MDYLKHRGTLQGPFAVILDRLKAKLCPFILPFHHTVVSAFTLAVPVLPLQVQWLVRVPRFVSRLAIGWHHTVFNRSLLQGACLLASFHTSSGEANGNMSYQWCSLVINLDQIITF